MSKVPENCKNICNYAYPNLAIVRCIDFVVNEKCMKKIINKHYLCTKCINKNVNKSVNKNKNKKIFFIK